MEVVPDEKNKKEIGAAEIGAGTVAGVGAAAVVSNTAGSPVPIGNGIPSRDEFLQKLRARMQSPKSNEVTSPIFEEFRKMHPISDKASAAVAKAWSEQAIKYCDNHPAYRAFFEAEQKLAAAEYADTIKHILKKAGKPSTVDDIIKAMDEAKNPVKVSAFKKPFLAFNSLSVGGKIGVGVVALASALGVGVLVNKWRNKEDTAFAAKLDQERAEPKFRTLSDI